MYFCDSSKYYFLKRPSNNLRAIYFFRFRNWCIARQNQSGKIPIFNFPTLHSMFDDMLNRILYHDVILVLLDPDYQFPISVLPSSG